MENRERRLEVLAAAIRERIKELPAEGAEAVKLAQMFLTAKRSLYALRGRA